MINQLENEANSSKKLVVTVLSGDTVSYPIQHTGV